MWFTSALYDHSVPHNICVKHCLKSFVNVYITKPQNNVFLQENINLCDFISIISYEMVQHKQYGVFCGILLNSVTYQSCITSTVKQSDNDDTLVERILVN